MRGLARHWALGLLLAAAAPLLLAFAGRGGIASFGDDSASYIALARWIAGTAGEPLQPWLPWHSHFGPLFPLALAATGAAGDFARAHSLVALFAVAAIVSVYRFVLAATGRRDAALATAVVFMLTPSAWLSTKGILSEPMYLVLSLEALTWHASRLGHSTAWRDLIVFGALLAAALLTRAAAVALLAACAVHLAIRGRRDARAWLALIVPAACALAWSWLRPGDAQAGYAATLAGLVRAWSAHTTILATQAPALALGGWTSGLSGVSAFAGDAPLPIAALVSLRVLAAVAIAGAVMRARHNALDGWYVLATVALLLAWAFDEENMRRLLYPVLPLMLFHAGLATAAAARRAAGVRYAVPAVAAAAALVVALAAPALASFAAKSGDRAPLLEGHAVSAADMSEYYRIANVAYARSMAARHAAVLSGFEMLARVTPPGARIMCVRPEYAALLGNRPGAELDYAWDARRLGEAVASSHADFIVATSLSKTDLALALGDAMASASLAAPYARKVFVLGDDARREHFVVLEVDRAALARFLGGAP